MAGITSKSRRSGEIATGAFGRLRRVRALVGNCASTTRAHVTRRGHLRPFVSPLWTD
ncbi:hypothetical protein V8C35DRAFT_310419 [Trichoderma chlorosporum]